MYSVVWKCERRCPSLRTYRALEHMEIIRAYFNAPPFCTLSETRLQENAGGELVPVLLWSSHCPGTPCCPLVVPPALLSQVASLDFSNCSAKFHSLLLPSKVQLVLPAHK